MKYFDTVILQKQVVMLLTRLCYSGTQSNRGFCVNCYDHSGL